MAILSDIDRHAAWARFMADASSRREPLGTLAKANLRAVVNEIDNWIEANALAFNQAIPLPARTQLTARQKAELLSLVVRHRFEVA